METSARTLIVGFFTLAIALAGFLFVYWLHGPGGAAGQAIYRIRFEGPVLGLRPGVSVVFNGLRVGEVRRAELDPANPKSVLATIAVDPATPVREDTKVGVDSQGLMGSAVVSLTGGDSAAAPPAGPHGEPALLVADAAVSASLGQAAKTSLGKVNAILDDNAAPLHSMIGNINNFSEALARNSGRVDAILAGLAKMSGAEGAKAPPFSYDLQIPAFSPAGEPSDKQLAVADPTGLVVFDTQKILVSANPGERQPLEQGQWSDSIPKLVQEKITQSFEAAGFPRTVKAFEGFTADAQVLLDIRAFDVQLDPSPMAHVAIGAKLLGSDGKILAAQSFDGTAPANGADAPADAAALNQAFGKAAHDLVLWAREKLESERNRP